MAICQLIALIYFSAAVTLSLCEIMKWSPGHRTISMTGIDDLILTHRSPYFFHVQYI